MLIGATWPKLRKIHTKDIKTPTLDSYPVSGIKFGWGHKLNVLIVATSRKHFAADLYDLLSDEITVKKILFSTVPEISNMDTRIFITLNYTVVQSNMYMISLYSRNDFTLVDLLASPGWLHTLSDSDVAIVETPAVGRNDWKLLVAPFRALSKLDCRLQISKTIFCHDNRIKACICPNNCAAIVYHHAADRFARMILSDENGKWDTC